MKNLKLLTILPIEYESMLTSFKTKIQTLLLMVGGDGVLNEELSRITGITVGNQDPSTNPGAIAMASSGLIPFPPGSPGAVHAFYPLVGQHALLTCNNCHKSGKYVGTPNTCTLCHILKRPTSHYNGDCAACHTALSWEDAIFNHEGTRATDCVSCHKEETPKDHYSGQCSACHQTRTWKRGNI